MSAEESPFAAAPEAAAAPEGVAEEEAEPLDAQYDQTNMPPVDFPSPAAEQEDPIQKLLREKDAEIASLKQAILHQHKEIKRLKKGVRTDQPEDLKAASIEGIANQVIAAKPSKIELRWKKRFQELVAYKLENGHANVPQSYKDKSLHAWVRTQREAKKDYDKGKVSKMTQERVDALESIGFQWVVGHQPKDQQWEDMFQALLRYKQQHGHTRVSQNENKQLYKWVLNQRARRRLLETHGEGKAKGMTWARVEKLQAIDFCFEASSNRRRTGQVDMQPHHHLVAHAPPQHHPHAWN
jgi:hypothetical protein